jgi:formamidopyrimidine-DNA glycosylase
VPELPEVETVRRMLERQARGRKVRSVVLSGARLREAVPTTLPRRVRGRTITAVRRHGKYLLVDLSGGMTLISHLGMSGRWLYYQRPPATLPRHLHARIGFADGSWLWFLDPRRFGVLRAVPTRRLEADRALALLGPDPIASPPSGRSLLALARGARVAVKNFLLDQRRIAGVGNIYASEILHRAGVDPRRAAGRLIEGEWQAVAKETGRVLGEAIARMGTTFSMYRTLWNEPGTYGERLRVYDRAGEPCRACGTPVRRIVQGQRSTYYCPTCQPARPARGRAGRESTVPRRRRATRRRAPKPAAARANRG